VGSRRRGFTTPLSPGGLAIDPAAEAVG
jgi:hypothetical protein